MADIFTELRHRLGVFGEDARTQTVVSEAVGQNPWFTPGDIVRAARNIAEGMLTRNAIEKWLAGYSSISVGKQRNILIIMAGNIPFVGFQDLLCVLASGHRALLKMSSKDRVLMSYIVEELLLIEPSLSVSEYDGEEAPDAVIAMGGDNAVRAIRNRYVDIPALLRGNRSSLAVISGDETDIQIDGLADDILSYSGLGCRNVSLVFVPEEFDITRLENALRSKAAGLNQKYLNNCRQVKALLSMSGVKYIDCGSSVLCDERLFPASVSRINYSYYTSLGEAAEWIARHEGEIQCVAGVVPFERAVGFGGTQKPSLSDYPDGRDTMEFLVSV